MIAAHRYGPLSVLVNWPYSFASCAKRSRVSKSVTRTVFPVQLAFLSVFSLPVQWIHAGPGNPAFLVRRASQDMYSDGLRCVWLAAIMFGPRRSLPAPGCHGQALLCLIAAFEGWIQRAVPLTVQEGF